MKIFRCFVSFFMLFLFSVLLFGCSSNSSIQFNKSNKADKLLKEFKGEVTTKKSSGVIIYKDSSVTNQTSENIRFGPKDLNFDLNIK